MRLGIAHHFGWAVAVTASSDEEVADRRRIELIEPGIPAARGVFAFGDARFAGSCPAIGGCVGSAVAVMPDHSGDGYWVVTSTGHIYSFGDAPSLGAPDHVTVSAVATPDGEGYWILLGDGRVFGYGDADTLGSPSPANFNDLDVIIEQLDASGYGR
jgi:hypothetical protein